METLFSREDLSEILIEAESNQNYYLGTRVLNGQSNERTIITISETKQLVFVEGNDHTGFKHLRERHNLFEFKNYWILDNEKGYKLDKPSKFNPKMMPIIEYVKIADAIFEKCNKNVTTNKRPEEFDKYTGEYGFESQKKEIFHLLTYKDSKIVHSLFPDKKKHNRKIIINYGKGFVSTKIKFPEAYNDLIVPYENERGMIEYSILIRKFYIEGIERTFVSVPPTTSFLQ
jgi:hypothetical protein